MKLIKLATLIAAGCLLLSMTALSGASAAEVIELKVGVWQPPMHPVVQQVYIPWGKMIEERTKGRVKFKWFLGGTLVKNEQGLSAVKSGLADIVMPLSVWAFNKQFPVTSSLFLPFQLESELHASQSYYECYKQVPALAAEYKDMKVLGFFSSGIVNLHMKNVLIKKLSDMKNQKIWAANTMGVTCFKIWGASPRVVKMADIYMSLQRGALDGVMFPTPPLHSFRFTDLVNKHTIIGFTPGAQIAAMNLKKWNSLPPDIQKVFNDLNLSLSIAVGAKFMEMNQFILAQLKKRGDQIYVVPQKQREEWKATLKPVYDDHIKDMDKVGLKGRALMAKIEAVVQKASAHPLKRDAFWKPLGAK
ncbi:MAG: TRAP transporter substrate-binding protein DctP [Thermodesulfobacteriota bacterium]